ncbi:beta-phosphoglucomutase [Dyella japonica]|uniref:Beta-phosphoglucomutase n=1 Tax=Dyella japonica A8 TaxID=1217721 RepID=A0A075K4C0_9GAMM|nr:beta-phosphoglucomutase [Dyella japonica]AIF47013.1 beta-phosphoglucomutase [Dyella japonica A8]
MDHRETAQALPPSDRARHDPWVVTSRRVDPACFAQDESLFALSNGALGVRGGLEEDDSPSQGCFLAGAWERTPIEYHERFPGFAAHTDTRIPVADATRIHLRLGDTPVRLGEGEWQYFERALDLRSGCYRRQLGWRSPEGATLLIEAERIVSLDRPALLAIRFRVHSIDYTGPVTLESSISTARNATEQGDDPRIGTRVDGGLATIDAAAGESTSHVLQCTAHSDIRVACMQQHAVVNDSLRFRLANLAPHGVMQVFEGKLSPGRSVVLEKYVAYAWTQPGGTDTDAELLARTAHELANAHALGHGALLTRQTSMLAQLWQNADLAIDGDDATEQALRFNLFHVFQSSSRDGLGSTAAKGLTGEGYEGHYFWDAEVFMLPAMVAVAPHVARSMLMYRHGTLERARAHARELNHARGALYAWRTISGDECSAYFPSGSAQYHINAAVAWAIRHYVDGTGDEAFLRDAGAEMLFETARVWLDIGHFNPRRDGAFCIHGVTGPDEYTALVDNNHYTNRMAQRHLRDAAAVAHWLQDTAPALYAELSRRIGLEPFEIMQWQRAAEQMYLAEDAQLRIFPQDDTFLDKPRMPARSTGEGKRPLLLELHPLTIYRHQVCKQADAMLALMLAGDGVPVAAKRRNFDYYEGVTVHDSTLSASTFSVMAAEVGAMEKAWHYFQDTLRVDLDDLHGNAAHGLHMAAMAGSWLSLAWGYGGMRVVDGELSLHPQLPGAWRSYRFGISWRGAHLRVDVDANGVRYTVTRGDQVTFRHAGEALRVRNGEPVSRTHRHQVMKAPLQAVIFDLDGVIADTAVVHRAAWERLAREIGAPFDEDIAARMKGVDRRGSLDILLERAPRAYGEQEKCELEARKNGYYVERIESFGPDQLLPGARDAVESVRAAGLRIGLASASRNAPLLLERLGIAPLFDYIVDAARIERSKPDPEIFLAAAAGLGVPPEACLGVEDAAAGVDSIHAAGMVAIGMGRREDLGEADIVLPGLIALRIADFVDNKNGATARVADATNINA